MINIEYNLKQRLLLVMSEIAIPADKQRKIMSLFPNLETIWQGIDGKYSAISKLCGDECFMRLKYSLVGNFADKIEGDLNKKNIVALTVFDQQYPQLLLHTSHAPLVLYCMGDISLLSAKCFSVVGTRKVTAYGKRTTQYFVNELAKHFVIVSGLAYGVDTAAHETTLEVGGKTIAVLGSGLLNIYPSSNEGLARQIIDSGGLIVSEQTSFTAPNHYNFPLRNRIIAGLSQGLLITEAPLKSGVFSTFEYALEQGRDVFVVPGDIFSVNYKGNNSIIQKMQGAVVCSPKDILTHYDTGSEDKKFVVQLDFDEQLVLDILHREDKLHFDNLVTLCGLGVGKLNYLLSSLELKGFIVKQAGNFYQYANTESE